MNNKKEDLIVELDDYASVKIKIGDKEFVFTRYDDGLQVTNFKSLTVHTTTDSVLLDNFFSD